jgi:TPR repeat protein
VPKDFAEAAKWYRKAADQGDSSAQFKLGNMYNEGRGVPQDFVLAYLWLNLAASQASAALQRHYGISRDLVAKKLLPQQLAEAQRLAREWKPKEATR